MKYLDLAIEYIAKHARNIEQDTILHLKGLAAHIEAAWEAEISAVKNAVEDVEQDFIPASEPATEVVNDVAPEVPSVPEVAPSAVEQIASDPVPEVIPQPEN